jgi:hypothetical protein
VPRGLQIMRTEVKLVGSALLALTLFPLVLYKTSVALSPATSRAKGRLATASNDPSAEGLHTGLRRGLGEPLPPSSPPPVGSLPPMKRHRLSSSDLPSNIENSERVTDTDTSLIPLDVQLERLDARHAALSYALVQRLAASGQLSLVWQQQMQQERGRLDQPGNIRTCGIAFFKTHKTGSTTVGAVLFRYAARHGLRIADAGELVLRPGTALASARTSSPPDLAVGHLTKSGGPFHWHPRDSAQVAGNRTRGTSSPTHVLDAFYSALLQGQQRPVPLMITVVRHPADRSRSHYDYYLRSTAKHTKGISHWINDPIYWSSGSKLPNYQCQELGLHNSTEVDAFVEIVLAPKTPLDRSHATVGFHLVMVAERMTDSLLLLRRALVRRGHHCDIIDLLHMSQPMARNWKGNVVPKTTLNSTDRTVRQCMS